MNGKVRITEMYAWVVVDDDGTEGVPAIEAPNRMVLPLMGADTHRAEQLRPFAEQVARDVGRPVTLLRFTVRETVDVVQPG